MKRITALTLTFILMLSIVSLSASAIVSGTTNVDVWDGTTATGFSGGSGLQNDPYIIKTGAELDLLAANCMGGETYADTYFRLEADIDWGGNLWTPIGYDNKHLFSGHFDGNGQTIYNLECFETYAGLFGAIQEGSVKNLKVDHATFTTDKRFCGSIVAWASLSTIESISAGEHVIVKTADIITSSAQMGGCIGYSKNGTVTGATFYGEVICTTVPDTSFVGGIIGVLAANSTLKYAINHGKVSNVNPSTVADAVCYLGGVVGGIGATDPANMEYCINFGEVSSVDLAGGVVGRVHVDRSSIKNCYSLGAVNGARVGTVLGYLAKLYVMEGNMGVAMGDATVALGYEKASSNAEYKSPNDSNLQVASEAVITSQAGFYEAESQTAVLMPIFNLVTPTEPAVTTEPDTTEDQTTETPDVTDAPDSSEEEKTDAPDAPEATDAPTTSTPSATDPAPKEEKGCGGALGFAAVLLCILPVAFISKKH